MGRTVDTDVVPIAIGTYEKLNAQEVWISFGTGGNFRLNPVHTIVESLGPEKSLSIPLFHALTGCDTVSFFYGKKKTAMWEVWKIYPI